MVSGSLINPAIIHVVFGTLGIHRPSVAVLITNVEDVVWVRRVVVDVLLTDGWFWFAYTPCPPDPAGAFIRYHARANRVARGAGCSVQLATVWINPAQYNTCTITAPGHFADMAACWISVGGKPFPGVVFAEGLSQPVAGGGDDAYAAPV